jgi:hypothetical protein
MELSEMMIAELISEDEKSLIYRYGHFLSPQSMTGQFRISNTKEPSISTVKLEDGYHTRANEIRIAGRVILEHALTGRWPKQMALK